ncbi:hypothetical protein FEV53_18930 [Palleronia caenipelagi]|uniref:Uncharacterized protein n=2 Tax=Palleronia caenipelagi TaxID=2489174 RepID=A0A547PJW7_9RHOB|nr:hypothetical protein [Palleronia caenipelagi]TRD14448.1 hypothetical protein FEV53_18930 [Palleronia caenipelagi]
MIVAAALSGGGSYYFAKGTIEAKDFDRAITFINQAKADYWCSRAKGQIVNADNGSRFCAIRMMGFQPVEKPAAESGQ